MKRIGPIRLFSALLLAGLAGAWVWRAAPHTPLVRADLQLTLTVRCDKTGVWRMEWRGSASEAESRAAAAPQELVFRLPWPSTGSLRLVPPAGVGEFTVVSLGVHGWGTREWRGAGLRACFSARRGIGRMAMRGDHLVVRDVGAAAELEFAPALVTRLRESAETFWPRPLSALLAAAFVFFLVFSVSPARLLPGRSWRGLKPIVPLFLVVLLLPGVLYFQRFTDSGLAERGRDKPPPRFRWQKPFSFAKACEEYFNERFGRREALIRANNILSVRLFRRSPLPAVVLGREGWLFFDDESGQRKVIDYYRNVRPFSEAELVHWRRVLAERAAWLKRLGARYVFAVVPNKSTIYPEMLPAHIRRAGPRSRLDQLLDHIARHPLPDGPEIIDLRPALWRAKPAGLLYMRTDSHWNELGGYYGYREIMERLKRHFPVKPWPLEDFRVEWNVPHSGDLARILAMPEDFHEVLPRLAPLRPRTARIVEASRKVSIFKTLSATEADAGDLPRTVMIRDSFAHELMDFVSEHCRRVVYVWDATRTFHPDEILRERPQLVIEEMVERFFLDFTPRNPELPLR